MQSRSINLITAILITTLIFAVPTSAQNRVSTKNSGFSLILPAHWTEFRDPSVTKAFSSPAQDCICSVKVTHDYDIGIMGIDSYVQSMTAAKMEIFLSVQYEKPQIHQIGEYHFAGRKRLHIIYSGYLSNEKFGTVSFQTIRGPYIYTLNCMSHIDIFPTKYKEFRDIADTFKLE